MFARLSDLINSFELKILNNQPLLGFIIEIKISKINKYELLDINR